MNGLSDKSLNKKKHYKLEHIVNLIKEQEAKNMVKEEYFEKVDWLRSIGDFAISTDIIVGFPGETEEQFEDTVSLVEKVGYSFIYSFKYSPRPGTAATRFRDQVPESEKSRRLKRLNELQDRITIKQNQEQIGKETEVLVHYRSNKEPNIFYGRTPQFRLARIESQRDIVGATVSVKIIDANKTALLGRLL